MISNLNFLFLHEALVAMHICNDLAILNFFFLIREGEVALQE